MHYCNYVVYAKVATVRDSGSTKFKGFSQKIDTPILTEYHLHHNYFREHQGLAGKTTAEAAGIDLKLDKQNPMKDLIIKSATASQKEKSPEMYVINQLGKRFEKLIVINENDCIKLQ